jgi:NADH-quinone oxidoreductase subunit C
MSDEVKRDQQPGLIPGTETEKEKNELTQQVQATDKPNPAAASGENDGTAATAALNESPAASETTAKSDAPSASAAENETQAAAAQAKPPATAPQAEAPASASQEAPATQEAAPAPRRKETEEEKAARRKAAFEARQAAKAAAAQAKAAAAGSAAAAGGAPGAAGSAPGASGEGSADAPPPKPPSKNQPRLDRAVQLIREQIAEDAVEQSYINELNDDMPTLIIKSEYWLNAAKLFRDHETLGCNYLRNITGVDYETYMEVVYFPLNMERRETYCIKVRTNREQPSVPSVVSVWATANWNEREIYDLLGIEFPGHPNLTRILMPEDWVGHPLRKDYVPLDPEV